MTTENTNGNPITNWYKQLSKGKKIALWTIASLLLIGLLSDEQTKNTDNKREIDSDSKTVETTSVPIKLADVEYIKYFKAKSDSIKLFKMYDQIPLYYKYGTQLLSLIQEINKIDSLYKVKQIKEVNIIFEKLVDKASKATTDYLKYGEPDKDFIYINSACKTALGTYLNDPDYEIVKDKYWMIQTKKGYDYKMQIRAKNKFGALILKEMIFQLEFNSGDKMYYVTGIKE
jgi:hypothetical protein